MDTFLSCEIKLQQPAYSSDSVRNSEIFSPYTHSAMQDLMQESTILPCDRDITFSRNQLDIKNIDADCLLNRSYLETDGSISSGMLTSDSCYTQSDNSSDTICINNDTVSPNLLFHAPRTEQDAKNSSWSNNTSNINKIFPMKIVSNLDERFWSESAESCLDRTPRAMENSHCFKICFDTEYSDDEENIEVDRLDVFICPVENDSAGINYPHTDSMAGIERDSFADWPNIRRTPVAILTPRIRKLIGPMENSNGFFCQKGLQFLSAPKLQIIVNDLLTQICHLNESLLELLPQRDELLYEKEVKKHEHDTFIEHLRSPGFRHKHSSSEYYDSSNGLNPPPNISFSCELFTSPRERFTSGKPMTKFKSYLRGFFSVR